jgi:hypothetical protein
MYWPGGRFPTVNAPVESDATIATCFPVMTGGAAKCGLVAGRAELMNTRAPAMGLPLSSATEPEAVPVVVDAHEWRAKRNSSARAADDFL